MATFEKKAIAPIVPGGVSFVSAEKANEVIGVLNALLSGRISPMSNVGQLTWSPAGIIWDLQALVDRVAVMEGILGTNPDANGNSANTNIQEQLNTVNTTLYEVITSLNTAFMNAECDNAGGITVTLTIPNLPS